MVDTHTGEGYDAPLPATAYAGAPELLTESAALLRLAAELHADRAGDATRAYWLRRAALADRYALLALEHAPLESATARDAIRDAERDAFKLAQWDTLHSECTAGEHGPFSPEWESLRPYVRQEYLVWKAAGGAECESA